MRTTLAALVLALPAVSQEAHTRYELLEPGSGRFRIVYDVTATSAGAEHYFNSVRAGSAVSEVAVTDLASGAPLAFELVGGERARELGHATARPDGTYIRVELARPVPETGGARLRIEKTYRDPATYAYDVERGELVFERSLSIPRNRVVLPAGWELVGCNVPSQVLEEPDGRVAISFLNRFPAAAPLRLVARALPEREERDADPPEPAALIGEPPPLSAQRHPGAGYPVEARAEASADIVYFMRQPETHAFRLYHDFTETRAGVDRYLNVVRAGSHVSDPEALDLDRGAPLEVETLEGEAIAAAGIELDRAPTAGTQVVVVRFAPVPEGGSLRLRITETYTDPARYGLLGRDELVWYRRFGRATNAVVLPAGWHLTASAIPATVRELEDGRLRLDFTNPRPDRIVTLIKARRR